MIDNSGWEFVPANPSRERKVRALLTLTLLAVLVGIAAWWMT